MDETKLNIMTRAVRILIGKGVSIDEALDRYPKLTDAEKAVIKDRLNN